MLGDLAFSGLAHDLAGRLNYMSETAAPAHWLAGRKLAAIGVDGESPLVGGIHGIVERADFPLLAESRIFEAHGLEDGVSVVDFGELDVLWSTPCHFKGLASGHNHRRGGHPGALPDRVVVGGTRPGP